MSKKIIINIPDIFVSINNQHLFVSKMGKGRSRVALTTLARAYKDAIGWEAKRVYRGDLITGPVKVSIWYWFLEGLRKKDLGNDKLTADALEGIIYKNDSQIKELHFYKRSDSKASRTKIIIEELENEKSKN